MASKTIRDNYINASTALANNPASDARLNSGSYNNNSWCASRIDTSQYLEVCIFFILYDWESGATGVKAIT